MRARRRNLLRGCFPVEFGRGLKARAHGLVPRRACGRARARARCRGLLTAPSCSPRRRFWLTGVTVLVITRPPSIRCCAIARRPTDCALRPRGFDRRFDRSGQSIRHGAVVHCARRCRGHIAAGRSAGLDHTRQCVRRRPGAISHHPRAALTHDLDRLADQSEGHRVPVALDRDEPVLGHHPVALHIPVNVTAGSGIVTGIPMNVTAGQCCAI